MQDKVGVSAEYWQELGNKYNGQSASSLVRFLLARNTRRCRDVGFKVDQSRPSGWSRAGRCACYAETKLERTHQALQTRSSPTRHSGSSMYIL